MISKNFQTVSNKINIYALIFLVINLLGVNFVNAESFVLDKKIRHDNTYSFNLGLGTSVESKKIIASAEINYTFYKGFYLGAIAGYGKITEDEGVFIERARNYSAKEINLDYVNYGFSFGHANSGIFATYSKISDKGSTIKIGEGVQNIKSIKIKGKMLTLGYDYKLSKSFYIRTEIANKKIDDLYLKDENDSYDVNDLLIQFVAKI